MINLEQQYVDNAQPYPSWRQQQQQQGSVAPTLTDERISRSRLSLQLPHHLMSDNISRTILPYGASQWLGESQEQWTIPTAKLSRAPE